MRTERLVDLLEALQQGDRDLSEWSRGVVQAAGAALGEGLGVNLWAARTTTGHQLLSASVSASGQSLGEQFDSLSARASGELPGKDIGMLFPDHLRVAFASDRAAAFRRAGFDPGYFTLVFDAFGLAGATDAMGLGGWPLADVGACLMVFQRERRVPRRAEMGRLTELSLHVEAALRVRLAPQTVLGTVSPAGKLELSGTLPQVARAQLGEEVRRIEKVRTRARRADGEAALDAWRALCAGYVTLVERQQAGRREYVLCENLPRRRQVRGLSREEAAASIQLARGLSNKAVAYSLGWSESGTADRLSRAAAKLGLASTHALARVLAGLGAAGGPSRELDLGELTESERAVAELLGEGLSNEEIAACRGVAPRTVANQVASILRKTGAESRRAFWVRT